MNTPLTKPAPPDTGNWRDRAACLQVDAGERWFPEKGDSVRDAKAICAGCPSRVECKAFAVDNRIDDGIWGGLTAYERRQERRAANAARREVAA